MKDFIPDERERHVWRYVQNRKTVKLEEAVNFLDYSKTFVAGVLRKSGWKRLSKDFYGAPGTS